MLYTEFISEKIKREAKEKDEQEEALINGPKQSERLPAYKNWFDEGKVTTPYDQHGCGGCWAFSSAAATESLAFISGFDKQLTEYSVQ